MHNYSLGSIFAVSCELLCTEQGDGYISFSTVQKVLRLSDRAPRTPVFWCLIEPYLGRILISLE